MFGVLCRSTESISANEKAASWAMKEVSTSLVPRPLLPSLIWQDKVYYWIPPLLNLPLDDWLRYSQCCDREPKTSHCKGEHYRQRIYPVRGIAVFCWLLRWKNPPRFGRRESLLGVTHVTDMEPCLNMVTDYTSMATQQNLLIGKWEIVYIQSVDQHVERSIIQPHLQQGWPCWWKEINYFKIYCTQYSQ